MVNNKALKKQCRKKTRFLSAAQKRIHDPVHTVIKRCNLVPRVLSTWRESLRRLQKVEKKNSLLFISTFCHVLMGIPFEKKNTHKHTWCCVLN